MHISNNDQMIKQAYENVRNSKKDSLDKFKKEYTDYIKQKINIEQSDVANLKTMLDIGQKIILQCSYEEFELFIKDGEIPAVSLRNDELEMLKGGKLKLSLDTFAKFASTKLGVDFTFGVYFALGAIWGEMYQHQMTKMGPI